VRDVVVAKHRQDLKVEGRGNSNQWSH